MEYIIIVCNFLMFGSLAIFNGWLYFRIKRMIGETEGELKVGYDENQISKHKKKRKKILRAYELYNNIATCLPIMGGVGIVISYICSKENLLTERYLGAVVLNSYWVMVGVFYRIRSTSLSVKMKLMIANGDIQ